MFITKMALPRRTFLRGVGVTLALPLLDAMAPAAAATRDTARRPSRFGFVYMPHGADMPSWTPKAEGTGFEMSHTLRPLAPFKDSAVVVTNLKRAGTVVEMHAAAACGWLSGAIPKRTEGEDYEVGTTIDQVLARQIGQGSPLPSLEVATEDFTGYVGGCTPGFSCIYMNTISWASPTSPLPMEINPRKAFERLFGDAGSQTAQAKQMREDRSILDAVMEEARGLGRSVGVRDRARIADYMDTVREIERRIQRSQEKTAADIELPDKPLGVPATFDEHASLMFDLLALAFQADLTRVFTFMLSRESSQRTFPEIGVNDPWHVVSHHGEIPEKIARAEKVAAYCVNMFARFVDKLKATPDGDGSLLDNSLVFYGSGHGNANVHATDPLPMVAVGGGVRSRHLVLPPRTEIGNLWLTVANEYGDERTRFGESTGAAAFF
jgi:hypothetical protein